VQSGLHHDESAWLSSTSIVAVVSDKDIMLGFLRWEVIDNVIFNIDSKERDAFLYRGKNDVRDVEWWFTSLFYYPVLLVRMPFWEILFAFFLRVCIYFIRAFDVSILLDSSMRISMLHTKTPTEIVKESIV